MVDAAQDTPGYNLVTIGEHKINIRPAVKEDRSWEFNSVPCGWVGTVSVEPNLRMGGIGSVLYKEICRCFRKAGVTKIRTMIPRDATDLMSFFRAQGMMAGPFIQLETDMEEGA